nr:hypothetical protein [Tanacetum cinerariifolium]
ANCSGEKWCKVVGVVKVAGRGALEVGGKYCALYSNLNVVILPEDLVIYPLLPNGVSLTRVACDPGDYYASLPNSKQMSYSTFTNLTYAHESCKEMKACYRECKKELGHPCSTPNVEPASSAIFIREFVKLFDKRYPYMDNVARAYLLDPFELQNVMPSEIGRSLGQRPRATPTTLYA